MISLIGKETVKVTPSNTNYIVDATGNKVIGSLYIGVGGDVVALPWYHADTNSAITTGVQGAVLFKNVPDGSILPIAVRKVFQTGTDATDIVAIIN